MLNVASNNGTLHNMILKTWSSVAAVVLPKWITALQVAFDIHRWAGTWRLEF